ncbi:hypothetical protein [Rhodanobacter sp. MP1X3]|uniref:hypothetical protein n=1 Tax=Rhodanobacter sp. MP1X3 TaxID=2723086 RepID=UPI00161B844E|nr:hypothetical protein [Rhodanobacter sp. MP1X3]MBB6244446.1 hypothetical protein [Rhodanobacter sp. MP1X3]
MHASTDFGPNADDVAAIWNLRETLLAQNWPDSETIGSILGLTANAHAESKATSDRGNEDTPMFGVWAGRDRGGYRYPPFQFLKSGLVHPQLLELMEALARQPGLHPRYDKSGWERAFWLYQPRKRLSVQALELRAAKLKEVQENPERFATLANDARTPAEVFSDDCLAVIDLANEDADQLTCDVSVLGGGA